MQEPEFRTDLYRGTASYYDRYRLPYPQVMLDDLVERAQAGTGGRLLDLACGTGQVAFGLHRHFGEVLAVDQEAETVEFGRLKAQRDGITGIRWIAQSAQDLDAGTGTADLITIGNAFHRLPRRRVADQGYRWLRPGRCLALLWSDPPWAGDSRWQMSLSDVITTWKARAGAASRIPEGLDQALAAEPNQAILAGAGFEMLGTFGFVARHEWTVRSLAGFLLSTSFLSPAALGSAVPDFEADLSRAMLRSAPGDRFSQDVSFAYDLARRPAPGVRLSVPRPPERE